MKNNNDRAIELTSCGDSNEYGAVIWFGTKSQALAKRKMKRLAKLISDKQFKKFSREK